MDDDAYNAICEVIDDQTHALTPKELEAVLRAVMAHCMTLLEALGGDELPGGP
jgi:hypothetical protein